MEKEECPGAMRTMSKRRISREWNPSRPNNSTGFQNGFGLVTAMCFPFFPFSSVRVDCSYLVLVPPLYIGGSLDKEK